MVWTQAGLMALAPNISHSISPHLTLERYQQGSMQRRCSLILVPPHGFEKRVYGYGAQGSLCNPVYLAQHHLEGMSNVSFFPDVAGLTLVTTNVLKYTNDIHQRRAPRIGAETVAATNASDRIDQALPGRGHEALLPGDGSKYRIGQQYR